MVNDPSPENAENEVSKQETDDQSQDQHDKGDSDTSSPAADDILTPRKDHPRYEPTSNL